MLCSHVAKCLLVGQLALDDQVGDLEVVALLGQFLDRIAAVAQDALVAVDVGDAALARGGVGEGRVVGHQAEVVGAGLDLAQIGGANHVALLDRNLVLLAGAIVGDGQRVLCHRRSPFCLNSSLRVGSLARSAFQDQVRESTCIQLTTLCPVGHAKRSAACSAPFFAARRSVVRVAPCSTMQLRLCVFLCAPSARHRVRHDDRSADKILRGVRVHRRDHLHARLRRRSSC